MTDEQFDAIATLIRMKKGRSREAARLVLVEGILPTDAAALVELSRSAVRNTVKRVEHGMQLARRACGLSNE